MQARVAAVAAAATAGLVALAVGLVLAGGADPSSAAAQGFLPNAVVSAFALTAAFAGGLLVRQLDLRFHRLLPWLIAGVSFTLTVLPFALLTWGNVDTAALLYRGLRIPQGMERFWDLALVLRSIDCSSWGFDVFVDNNGCLKDAAIYGPGMLWLQVLPIFTFAAVTWIGVALAAGASLGLAWLARASSGVGQLVLLVAAVGTPWLLLLERGNIDAVIFLAVIVAVATVRRWPEALWSWGLAASLAWLMGTWKYYPFAMGLFLLPVLRLRRGWVVLASFATAAAGYLLATWSNFRFSAESNGNMTEIGDLVVLGRVPVVARFVGSAFPASGMQTGDVLIVALAASALAWGAVCARGMARMPLAPTMLALAGAPIYLASVFVAGFGWGYKTAFLLLCIPILAPGRYRTRALLTGSVTALALIAIAASVSANALLATLAGIVAASFSSGMAAALALGHLRRVGARSR